MTTTILQRHVARCDGHLATACHRHQCPAEVEAPTPAALTDALRAAGWAITSGVFVQGGQPLHWCPAHVHQAP